MDQATVTLEQYIATLNEVLAIGTAKGWLKPTNAGYIMAMTLTLQNKSDKQGAK